MNSKKHNSIFILDTSAILSGKPLDLEDAKIFTTTGVSKEIKPGGRDYRQFQFLIEKGLKVFKPSEGSIEEIKEIAKKTGDLTRLSSTDIELLALTLDFNKKDESAIILTDDYSIQNVAKSAKISYEPINQHGITKNFKWIVRCRGCGKYFKEQIKTCPICGSETRLIIAGNKNSKRGIGKDK
jgi:UPF0271 protein